MTSIRRFVFATLLAFTALNFSSSLASAQEPARGKFTLTHEVHWGTAKLPEGDYQFSFDPSTVGRMLTLSKVSGIRTGYMVLVPAMEETNSPAMSRLVLEATPEGSYVSAMLLPEFGMTLRFSVPRVRERQIAKAAPTLAPSGQ
jgi:hypothetical protein